MELVCPVWRGTSTDGYKLDVWNRLIYNQAEGRGRVKACRSGGKEAAFVKKLVVVINGAGGVGKDTMCAFAAERYRVRNVSSVEPIKAIARAGGWDGDKSDKARKLLSDLKALFTRYNDLCFRYICGEYEQFLNSDGQVMFVHIREPEEIARFAAAAPGRVRTLLITNSTKQAHVYQNASDDNVAQYDYDCVYDNRLSLEETREAFLAFFDQIFEQYAFEG